MAVRGCLAADVLEMVIVSPLSLDFRRTPVEPTEPLVSTVRAVDRGGHTEQHDHRTAGFDMNVHRGPGTLARLLDALSEPTRRRAYEAVQRARGPLSRAEVAHALDISTRLAAFHLDRLVQEGLLVAHYARPAGRPGGPGAGRPTKWYTPTADGLEVTVPPRRNDIAARILLRAFSSQAQGAGDAV